MRSQACRTTGSWWTSCLSWTSATTSWTSCLAASLKQLDLSGNKISLLPNYFCNLRELITVNMTRNQLKALPPSIGKLTKLKHFRAADNNIQVLPGSFSRLRLDNLELSANNFDPACAPRTLRDRLEPVSSLLELAAVQVVTRNIAVTEEDVGPL